MLLLELLENIELLLLIACGLACLLLSLVKHHLLHHAACLAIEITQLAVLGLDLGGIYLGRRCDNVGPPLELVHLIEMNGDFFARGGRAERPCGLIDMDRVRKFALRKRALVMSKDCTEGCGFRRRSAYVYEGLLALDGNLQGIAADLDVQVLALVFCVDGNGDVEVLNGLVPLVGKGGLLSLLLCAGLCVSLFALLGRGRAGHGVLSEVW